MSSDLKKRFKDREKEGKPPWKRDVGYSVTNTKNLPSDDLDANVKNSSKSEEYIQHNFKTLVIAGGTAGFLLLLVLNIALFCMIWRVCKGKRGSEDDDTDKDKLGKNTKGVRKMKDTLKDLRKKIIKKKGSKYEQVPKDDDHDIKRGSSKLRRLSKTSSVPSMLSKTGHKSREEIYGDISSDESPVLEKQKRRSSHEYAMTGNDRRSSVHSRTSKDFSKTDETVRQNKSMPVSDVTSRTDRSGRIMAKSVSQPCRELESRIGVDRYVKSLPNFRYSTYDVEHQLPQSAMDMYREKHSLISANDLALQQSAGHFAADGVTKSQTSMPKSGGSSQDRMTSSCLQCEQSLEQIQSKNRQPSAHFNESVLLDNDRFDHSRSVSSGIPLVENADAGQSSKHDTYPNHSGQSLPRDSSMLRHLEGSQHNRSTAYVASDMSRPHVSVAKHPDELHHEPSIGTTQSAYQDSSRVHSTIKTEDKSEATLQSQSGNQVTLTLPVVENSVPMTLILGQAASSDVIGQKATGSEHMRELPSQSEFTASNKELSALKSRTEASWHDAPSMSSTTAPLSQTRMSAEQAMLSELMAAESRRQMEAMKGLNTNGNGTQQHNGLQTTHKHENRRYSIGQDDDNLNDPNDFRVSNAGGSPERHQPSSQVQANIGDAPRREEYSRARIEPNSSMTGQVAPDGFSFKSTPASLTKNYSEVLDRPVNSSMNTEQFELDGPYYKLSMTGSPEKQLHDSSEWISDLRDQKYVRHGGGSVLNSSVEYDIPYPNGWPVQTSRLLSTSDFGKQRQSISSPPSLPPPPPLPPSAPPPPPPPPTFTAFQQQQIENLIHEQLQDVSRKSSQSLEGAKESESTSFKKPRSFLSEIRARRIHSTSSSILPPKDNSENN